MAIQIPFLLLGIGLRTTAAGLSAAARVGGRFLNPRALGRGVRRTGIATKRGAKAAGRGLRPVGQLLNPFDDIAALANPGALDFEAMREREIANKEARFLEREGVDVSKTHIKIALARFSQRVAESGGFLDRDTRDSILREELKNAAAAAQEEIDASGHSA